MLSCGASVVLQEADGRGVALERLIREGINLERQINMSKERSKLVRDRESFATDHGVSECSLRHPVEHQGDGGRIGAGELEQSQAG
jgi:hypothetical protein